jgi:hypothetical protein
MNPFRSLWNALRRRDDLSEELASHLRMAIADRIARGESPAGLRPSIRRAIAQPQYFVDHLLLSGMSPAHRAASVQPMQALRTE